MGALSVIVSDNKMMFIGKQVAELLGHTNLTQAIISANLNDSEYSVFKLIKNKDLKTQLDSAGLVGRRAASITLLTGMGLCKLILASEKLIEKRHYIEWLQEIGVIDNDILLMDKRKEIEFGNILVPFIKELGFNISTQYTIGSYRLDFFIEKELLCIEFDENRHKYSQAYDKERDSFLLKKGIKTIRISEFSNHGQSLALIYKHLISTKTI